jgi:2-haloacid dehalogenase
VAARDAESMTVTFDVFSALTDSRSGGSAFLDSVVARNGWATTGAQLYDRWDALNKASHARVENWAPFVDLSAHAMEEALTELQLPTAGARQLSSELVASMADWPLWPDVTADSLRDLGNLRLGLLSNIDDDLLAATAVMRLGVFDSKAVVTSQRAQAYKPSPLLYGRATELLGPFVHVASSARDVRGAVSAGIRCIRLARPGHSLDASGPVPQWTVVSITSLRDAVAAALERRE